MHAEIQKRHDRNHAVYFCIGLRWAAAQTRLRATPSDSLLRFARLNQSDRMEIKLKRLRWAAAQTRLRDSPSDSLLRFARLIPA